MKHTNYQVVKQLWNLIDKTYRVELANISIPDLPKYGIVSTPYYYQLRNDSRIPTFETACYIALGFFSVFLKKGVDPRNPKHLDYIKMGSKEVCKEIADLYVDIFLRRNVNGHPLEVPISNKHTKTLERDLINLLVDHDTAILNKSSK